MKSMTQRKIIIEITDADFNSSFVQKTSFDDYVLRKAARGVLIKDGNIALMHVTNKNYYKLPGGGLEENESIEEGFKREILEETGYKCELMSIDGACPVAIEYLDKLKIFHISYVLFAKTVGEPVEIAHTDDEISDGFVLEWVSLSEVLTIMDNNSGDDDYQIKFIQKRDRAIVNYFISEGLIATTSL